MKFNTKVLGPIVIYVAGAIYLVVTHGTALTISLFGFISLVFMALTPPPHATEPPDNDKELKMARGVQQAILNLPLPDVPTLEIASHCEAAQSVGGDFTYFYARETREFNTLQSDIPGVLKLDDHREVSLSVGIGDVAGHGVSSALVMALTTGLLSEVAKTEDSPSRVLSRVNNYLVTHIGDTDIRYVTCAYITIYPKSMRLVYSRAGHPPAAILRKNQVLSLDAPGLFLGMYPDETYTDTTIQLMPGDRIVMYSDGMTEVTNSDNVEYGLDGLKSMLLSTATDRPNQALNRITEDLAKFGSVKDDQTIIIIDVKEQPQNVEAIS